MRQSTLEANSSSPGQGIPHILWNMEFRYGVHNSPPLVPTPRQSSALYAHPPLLFLEGQF